MPLPANPASNVLPGESLVGLRIQKNRQTKDAEMADTDTEGLGHNSGERIGGIAAEALQGYVDRIERLNEEKKALNADISQIYQEAKAVGFDVKILKKLIRERTIAEHDRQEQDEILDLYRRALGGTKVATCARTDNQE